MSIQVALIDKSEIIQKMLAHCLHYFSSEVVRFNSLEECQAHFTNKTPDIVFVDGELQHGKTSIIVSVLKKFQSTPVVLLYRSGQDQLNSIPLDQMPHRIQKPLDPKAVRHVVTKLVPQLEKSNIHSFLQFPKTAKEKTQDLLKKDSQEDKKKPPLVLGKNIQKNEKLSKASSKEHAIIDEVKEQTKTFFKQTFTGFLGSDKTQDKEVPLLKTKKPTANKSQSEIMQHLVLDNESTKTPTVSQSKNKGIDIPIIQQETQDIPIKNMRKDDISIDDNTQNDLAPMAIKSSVVEGKASNIQKFELSDKDIIRVLNKYKDTIEFQELMEKTLSGYAKDTVAHILKSNKENIVQQPLKEFVQESKKFTELVESQITLYVQKQLPLVIKEIVEKEIKQIIKS